MDLNQGTVDLESADDVALADKMNEGRKQIIAELQKRIVGQSEVIELVLLTLFVGGNSLIVGVPGLAKTLLIATLAQVLELRFNRIQFTPDLMPSDITGTDIIQEDPGTGRRQMVFAPGPIFANIVLADEINRTPPKTQAALLQAMQEHEVTAGGQTHKLELPFFVLATQNPIELEGTYPLPEAQLDRFMFQVLVGYPSAADEERIVAETTGAAEARLEPVLSGADIMDLQRLVRRVPASEHVVRFAVELARSTRPGDPKAPDFVNRWLAWGAGPRASQYLILGAKTRAVLHGRFAPGIEDVRALAPAVLRHRLVTNFNAEADGVRPDRIVNDLLSQAKET